MNRKALVEQMRLLDELERRRPAWKPMREDRNRPGYVLPQSIAFDCTASIIGYGGAAGGGKSDWLIGMALMKAKNAIIYRKTYSGFEALTRRFSEIVGDKYIKQGAVFRVDPPTGFRSITAERIVLAQLNNEIKDREKYQGRPYDLICFDESTQFTRASVEYLMQWNRSADASQRCQVLLTFNPPTSPEGLWVKDYFAPWLNKAHHLYGKVESGQVMHRVAIPTADGQSSTFHYLNEAKTVTHDPVTGVELKQPLETISITFVKSLLSDNLFFQNSDYATRLRNQSDTNMARIMLDGDFDTDFKDGILSVFKPHHWAKCVERWKALQALPTHPPDVVAIDAAKGGDDDMVVQLGYRITEQGNEDQFIYLAPLKVRGALVNTHVLQWHWLTSQIPDLLDARLFVIDVVGGAGETIAAYLEAEVAARHKKSNNVIRFQGGRNSNWRTINDWATGQPRPGAMAYANDITAAWNTAAEAQQHTETCTPPDEELQRQCLSRNYKNTDGNYQLEPKDSFSQRLGRSPDHADAYSMAAIGLHRYLNVYGR